MFVEKSGNRPPVKIGVGTNAQAGALREAGAEVVRSLSELAEILEDEELLRVAFRPGDVVIFVQPNILAPRFIRQIGASGPLFQVPGHKPMKCSGDTAIRNFRKLEPITELEPPKLERRGAPATYAAPTPEQMELMIALWQTPEIKRAEVVRRVSASLGREVSDHWVRDKVAKATGSPARKPQAKEQSNG